jgi:excisionase family DNA binding protein
MADNEKIYTPSEIAEKLQVNKETVLRKIRKGEMKAFKVGRLWRITEESLNQYKGK